MNLQFGQVLVVRRSLLHTASIPCADSVGTGGSGGGGDEDLPRQLLLLAHKMVLTLTWPRDLSKEVCESSVAQSCPTFCDPMDCSLPDSSICGIFQVRILEWVAISFSRGSSQSRDGTCVSCIFCIGRQILYHWTTWGASEGDWGLKNLCFKRQKIKGLVSKSLDSVTGTLPSSSVPCWSKTAPRFRERSPLSTCEGEVCQKTGRPMWQASHSLTLHKMPSSE